MSHLKRHESPQTTRVLFPFVALNDFKVIKPSRLHVPTWHSAYISSRSRSVIKSRLRKRTWHSHASFFALPQAHLAFCMPHSWLFSAALPKAASASALGIPHRSLRSCSVRKSRFRKRTWHSACFSLFSAPAASYRKPLSASALGIQNQMSHTLPTAVLGIIAKVQMSHTLPTAVLGVISKVQMSHTPSSKASVPRISETLGTLGNIHQIPYLKGKYISS